MLDADARIVACGVRVRISREEIQRVWRRGESSDLVQRKEENVILFTILVQGLSAFW